MRSVTLVWVVAALVLVPCTAMTQSNVATGMLLGHVVDPDGAVVPGVEVVATNPATGLIRKAVTGIDGSYRLDLLPVGAWNLRVVVPGFRHEYREKIPVSLGARVTIDFALALAPVEGEFRVSAAAPTVETTDPSVTASVSAEAIDRLPLYGRDYADFVLLTPAAVAGRNAGLEREILGGQGGVSVGAPSIHNSFNIDGTSAQSGFFGNERGAAASPFTFSQAAIQEIQVIRSSYDLQRGAAGAVINAVTKSGTNDLHGQVFGYWSDDSMVADTARGEHADEFELAQYGLALGGPIVRDRLHFFTAFDGQQYTRPKLVEFRGFPGGREAEWEALTGLDWEDETGIVPESGDANVALVRLDWQLSPGNLLVARDNWLDYEAANGLDGFTTSGRSHDATVKNSYNSLVLHLTSVVSERAFNELIVHHSLERRPRVPNVTSIPEVWIGSIIGAFGQNNLTPNWLDEERLQIKDNFTLTRGRHSLAVGFDVEMVDLDNGFLRYGGGQYRFRDGWDQFLDRGTPSSYRQSFSTTDGRLVFSSDIWGAYVQDEWRPRPDLTLTWGLRYDLQDRPEPQETNPLYPLTGQIPDDTDNWAPRVGLAWDVGGRGTQVVRAGAGYFYSATPTVLDANAMLVNGISVLQVTSDCSSGDPCPTYPDRWSSVAGLPTVTPDIYVFDPEFSNPRTLRLSLGWEREVLPDLSVRLDAVYAETDFLHRNQDQNLERTGELTVDGRPVYRQGTVYPELGQVIMFRSDARSHSKALTAAIHKRFSSGWLLDASYTWSRTRDQGTNERNISTLDVRAEDQYDLGAEWGPSSFDVEHRFVLSAAVQLPWRLTVSTIATVRSGFPYTASHLGDLNGDGLFYTERAVVEVEPGVFQHSPRNGERQPWFRSLNLRLARSFRLKGDVELELLAEAFNALDRANWWVSRFNHVLSAGCFPDGEGGFIPCTTLDSFGEADIPGEPRTFQLGIKLRF